MADQKDDSSVAEFWEYVIAGIVILFFGALYWMLTRDIPEDNAGLTAPATTVAIADEQPSRVAQAYAERAKLSEAVERTERTATDDFPRAAPDNVVAPPSLQAAAIPATGAVTGAVLEQTAEADVSSVNVNTNVEISAPEAESSIVVEASSESSSSTSTTSVTPSTAPQATNDLEAAITNTDGQTSFVFDALYFDTGSENIKPESRPQIKAVADVLMRYPDVRVLVRGHTDNTGTIEGNAKLALDRSVSVGLALVALGVTKDRIEVESVGANEPVASNATEAGRQKNRRIELRIIE